MSSATPTAPSWHRGRVAGWLVSVDHKRIGALYLGTAGLFFVIAGILTLLMRLQVTRPDASILGSGTYRGVLTMHGTLLVFFVLVPVVTGLATHLVPLLIGARRIALPEIAAASLWLYIFAGTAVVLSAFAGGGASQAGWTGFPPLALAQRGNGVDLWLIGLLLLSISLLGSSANLVATIRSLRTDGMEWSRLPMFAWSIYVWSWLTIVLVPIAAVGLTLVLLERRFSGSFDFFLDGDAVKPKLIWLFGQSFAYVALVPVLGIVAEIVAVFSGRAIANARVLAQSLVALGGLMMLVVIYHAYSTGIGRKPSVVLLLLAVVATVPAAVALWLLKSSLWRARATLRWTAPLLFAAGAIFLLAIGLLSALGSRRLRQRPRPPRHRLRRRTRALPALGHGPLRSARGPRLLVAEDLRAAPRHRSHALRRRAALRRVQLHVLRPVPARRPGAAARRGDVRRAREHGGLQHDLDDRRLHVRRRRRALPACRSARLQRHARRQRPMARRHARVVHDVAAAGPQLRFGAAGHERETAPRPPRAVA